GQAFENFNLILSGQAEQSQHTQHARRATRCEIAQQYRSPFLSVAISPASSTHSWKASRKGKWRKIVLLPRNRSPRGHALLKTLSQVQKAELLHQTLNHYQNTCVNYLIRKTATHEMQRCRRWTGLGENFVRRNFSVA